jgi:hypothetical protein
VIRRFSPAFIWLVLFVAPSGADAQHFGRNKVEYTDFDFRVLRSEHFDVYYYSREEPAARLAAQLAERWYARFAAILGHTFDKRQPLVLYGSQPEFAQTNVVSGLLSDTVGGVTESAKRRIAMPFAPTLAETDRVLGHEIVHAFQFDIGRRNGGWGQPLWFVEGMAEYLARGPIDDEASMWLRDAVRSERLPRRERDAARQLSPYQYGHAFWSYLAGRFGDQVIERALKPGKQRKLRDRMRHATGLDLDAAFADWRAAVVAAYGGEDGPSTETVMPRWAAPTAFGRMQLGPAVSPDGRRAVFFSERDRLSLDLFLGDLASGQVIRKLATTTGSARFDSLQPLRSAGAWSPDGRQFAFPATRQGHAALVILDMQASGAEREIAFDTLGQILSIAWSPDGETLAFSALAAGFTDLFQYDLAGRHLRRLTADPFADLHPAWSPDGQTIAFATERYSSDLTELRFGRPQVATIDVESMTLSQVAPAAGVKQVNPQWSADGRHLYFVADPDGVSNVFSVDVRSGTERQVTTVDAGVSGLTPTSVAISLARRAPVLAVTVYSRGRYRMAILDSPRQLEGEPRAALVNSATAGAQPSEQGAVAQSLADTRTGLADPATIVAHTYTPRLSLERIGQPYVSSGGGASGTFVRGGGSLLFGDLLGERKVGAAVQIGNRLRDAAFEVRYLNQEHRWNWGAVAELEPSRRRYRRNESIEYDGQPALLKQADDLQRVQVAAAGVLAYPFNRGLRVEFSGGLRRASYHRELRSQIESAETGRVLEEAAVTEPGGASTTVAEFGTALVGDTAAFGPTGPLVGSRYRFEVAPAFGQLSYLRVLADYRRYVMPIRPYSLAVRLLHSGRYGRDADDPRLLSTFIGSRYFIRGHGLDGQRCRPTAERACGEELLGNRLIVANLELRFPLWGAVSRQLEYGRIPADGFVFADGGLIWSRRADLRAVGAARSTISSIGAGVRVNAGGLPFEFVAVRALDGPARGWTFDYGFRLGF